MSTIKKIILPLCMVMMIGFISCGETNASAEEQTEIQAMDSTTRNVEDATDKLDDQTKKVEESLEKLDKEFEDTTKKEQP